MFKEIKSRLSLPSNAFWKRIGTFSLIIGGIIGIIGTGLLQFLPTTGAVVIAIGATIASLGKFLSSLTIE